MGATKKILILGGIGLIGYFVYQYVQRGSQQQIPLTGSGPATGPEPLSGGAMNDTADGRSAKMYLASLEPNAQDFLSIVTGLSDDEAIAIMQWDQEGRAAGWQIDPLLARGLKLFQATPEHWFF